MSKTHSDLLRTAGPIAASGLVWGLIVATAGCAGHDYYVRGQEYVAGGELDRGVTELREAVRLDPGNVQYQMSLTEAQAAAAEMHYTRGERLAAEGRLVEAREELQKALELAPGHTDAETLLAQVNARLEGQVPGPIVSAPPSTAPAVPAPAPPAAAAAPPPAAPRTVYVDETPEFPPGSFPGTLSRDNPDFPKEIETLDGIIVRLKDTTRKPLRADIEVRVGKLVKRYRELREGSRITGRGESRRPYAITILGIEPESETVSFVVEPLTRLPPR